MMPELMYPTHGRCMGAFPTLIKAGYVIRHGRAVDTYRHTGTSFGEQIKQSG